MPPPCHLLTCALLDYAPLPPAGPLRCCLPRLRCPAPNTLPPFTTLLILPQPPIPWTDCCGRTAACLPAFFPGLQAGLLWAGCLALPPPERLALAPRFPFNATCLPQMPQRTCHTAPVRMRLDFTRVTAYCKPPCLPVGSGCRPRFPVDILTHSPCLAVLPARRVAGQSIPANPYRRFPMI